MAVRARCTEVLGSLFVGMPIQLLLALSIPTMLAVVCIGSLLWQVLATNRLRRSLTDLITDIEPTPIHQLRRRLRLNADSLVVVDSPRPLCFCTGFFHPRIYLSTTTVARLQEPELSAVLAHEDHHRRRRDPMRMALLTALQQALFFLPLVGVLRQRYTVAQEIAADNAALHQPGGRAALARALYQLSAAAVPRGVAVAFAQRGLISVRVATLAGQRFSSAPVPFVHIIATAVAMMLFVFLLTPPASARVGSPVHCPTGPGLALALPDHQTPALLLQSPKPQIHIPGGSNQRVCHQLSC